MSQEALRTSSVSEISHLFLSAVRDKHDNGSPRPVRIPPGQKPIFRTIPTPPSPQNASVDMTTEEFKQTFPPPRGTLDPSPEITDDSLLATPPISAVIASHLNEKLFDSVKNYARHLAAIHGRIGLIEVVLRNSD